MTPEQARDALAAIAAQAIAGEGSHKASHWADEGNAVADAILAHADLLTAAMGMEEEDRSNTSSSTDVYGALMGCGCWTADALPGDRVGYTGLFCPTHGVQGMAKANVPEPGTVVTIQERRYVSPWFILPGEQT